MSTLPSLQKITKGVGKNTCAYASLGNLLPISEQEIHEIMGNTELPKGLHIYQVKHMMEEKLSEYVENVRIVQPKDVAELEKIVKGCIEGKQTKIIANFQLRPIYPDYPQLNPWTNFGHFSPIVFAGETDLCIGDVWRKVPDYAWRSYQVLFDGINTIDTESRKLRGLLVFDLVDAFNK